MEWEKKESEGIAVTVTADENVMALIVKDEDFQTSHFYEEEYKIAGKEQNDCKE